MNFFLYVDPGSGLMLWQLIVSALIGGLFYLKKFRVALAKLGRRVIKKR